MSLTVYERLQIPKWFRKSHGGRPRCQHAPLPPSGGAASPPKATYVGRFLDTVMEGQTGVFFDEVSPEAVAGATASMLTGS